MSEDSIQSSFQQIQAQAVLNFTLSIKDASDLGFIDDSDLSANSLISAAQEHVKARYPLAKLPPS